MSTSSTRSPAPAPGTSPDRIVRRVTRRETHSPRTGVAVAVALAVVLACAYAGAETVLAMLGRPPLLAAPGDMASALVAAPTLAPAALVVGGVLVALLGIVTIVAAVRPARRPRHVVDSDRLAVVVDDGVIASALARHAATAAGVDPDDVVVSVGRGTATVRVTPASGLTVDREAVHRAVEDQIHRYGARPALRSTVVVTRTGRVGA